MPQFMSPPFRYLPLFHLAMPLLLLLLLLFCCSSPVALAWPSRNVPPQLLPLEGHQSPIRIALGTRGFKLSCPVQLNSEEGAATSDDEEEEEGTDHHEEQEEEELIIKWSKDGQPLQPEEGDPRFRLANRARDLRLLRAGPGDAGLYRCTAINEWGHRSVDFRLELLEPGSESAALEGVQLAQGGASAPAWRDPLGPQPLPVHVQAGQRLELRCPPAKANPLPQISWLRAGQPLMGEESTTLSLGMPRAQLTGGGLFSCRLQNHLGQIRADFLVQVEEPMAAADNEHHHHGNGADAASAVVTEPNLLLALSPSGNLSPGSPPLLAALPPPPSPRIEQPQRVRAGHTAELQCRVEWRGERDRAVIRWLRQVESSEVEAIKARSPNATLLRLGQVWLLMLDQHGHQQQQQQDSTRLEMGADGQRHFLNELRLPNVRKEDSGRYFCVVTNPAGQFVYRSALFYVVDDAQPTLLGLPLAASRFALLSGLGLVLCCLPALLCLRLCRPRASSKCASTHSGGTSANGTFASCASASATVTKASNSGGALPPPPRVPPPLLPPCNQAPLYCWPGQQLQQDGMMAPTTLNRRHQNATMEKPQMLHRTRAEEEMSRISSHIYASGSPLPPIYHFHANAQTDSQQQQQQQHLFFPPTSPNSFYGGRIHLEERDLHEGSPTASRLPPQNIVVVGQQKQQKQRRDRKRLGEEQKMPLIEAQRQSAELWRGN